jgi:hypothetical protein
MKGSHLFWLSRSKGMTVYIWFRYYNPPRCFQKNISGRGEHNAHVWCRGIRWGRSLALRCVCSALMVTGMESQLYVWLIIPPLTKLGGVYCFTLVRVFVHPINYRENCWDYFTEIWCEDIPYFVMWGCSYLCRHVYIGTLYPIPEFWSYRASNNMVTRRPSWKFNYVPLLLCNQIRY